MTQVRIWVRNPLCYSYLSDAAFYHTVGGRSGIVDSCAKGRRLAQGLAITIVIQGILLLPSSNMTEIMLLLTLVTPTPSLPSQIWNSGGRVVKLLACGARGPGFDSRPRHLNFQRSVISCFQVEI